MAVAFMKYYTRSSLPSTRSKRTVELEAQET